MKRALAAFVAAFVLLALSVSGVAVVAGSAIPSRLGAAIRSPEITDCCGGSVHSSRMAAAFDR
jgi:hypothetical protein